MKVFKPINPYSNMGKITPWNKGLKGFGSFNKGRKRPDLRKRNLENNPVWRKEVREKISESTRGRRSPNKGKKLQYVTERNLIDNPAKRPEVRKKMSETRKRLIAEGKVKAFGHGISAGRKGKLNPRWKGGISGEIKMLRNTPKYKEWGKQVFERDDYTCQKCGQRGGNLHADHIKSFTDYPKLRFEVSNGQTMCVSCHAKKTFLQKGGEPNV